MAQTKSGGSTKLGRDSESKRLGVKLYDGQYAQPGNIIVRQRGSRYIAGQGVKIAGDDTLYAIETGQVKFSKKAKRAFDRTRKVITLVEVVPAQ